MASSAADKFLDASPSSDVDAFLDASPPAAKGGTFAPAVQTVKDLATGYGPMEAVGNVVTSVAGGFPAYLGGGAGTLIARAAGTSDEDPQAVGGRYSDAVTYQPQTGAGKRLSNLLMYPFAKLTEGSKRAGQAVMDAELTLDAVTGGKVPASPTIAAAAEALISGAPLLAGVRGDTPTRARAALGREEAPTPRPAAARPPETPPGPPEAPASRPVPPEFMERPVAPRKAADVNPLPPPEPPPFPPEAGDLSGVVRADAFLDGETSRRVAAADAVASGEEPPAGALEEFPSLQQLERVKDMLKGSRGGTPTAKAALDKPSGDAIWHPDGEGFTWLNREDARAWAKKNEVHGYTPKLVDGGYVLEPYERSAKALEADRQRAADNSRIDPSVDDLPTMLGKLGGISKQALIDLGHDPADLHPLKGHFRSANPMRPAVRAGGLSLDGAAELLDQYGFDVRDETGALDASKLAALIDDHLSGERVFTPEGYERMAATEAEERAKAGQEEHDAALDEFGPGALGANAFLDPKVIGDTIAGVREDAAKLMRSVFGEPGEHRNLFNPIRDREQLGVARIERWAVAEGADIRKAFPTKEAREDLTRRIVTGDLSGMPAEQLKWANRLRANYRAMGEYAEANERIDGLRQNYSPQVWDLADKKTKDILDSWRATRGEPRIDPKGPLGNAIRAAGMDPDNFSPFMLSRSIADVFEGIKLGLKPKSLDAADLFETYARSMATAVERGKTLRGLMELVSDDGTSMVVPRTQAPRDYVKIDNPELEGHRVHPDVAPAVRVLVQTNEPGVIATVLQTLAYTTKRALVSYSFFHPKALAEAWVGTGGNPATMKTAIDAALKRYREGGAGDAIDEGLAGGLKIGAPLEDVLGRDKFKEVIERTANTLDKVGAGKPVRMFKELDEKLQRLTWNYIHTGLKLDTFMRKYGDLQLERARALSDGTVTKAELARQAAEFTNAAFGGLNWERMLDKFQTPTGRAIMSEILSKRGRSWMQTLMFAPDWTVSTFASWTNALPGNARNAARAQLARRYLATSALVTLTLGNAMNYYFTGHSMFENKPEKKNPSVGERAKAMMEVQLGDGRRTQIAKHFMEVPHAAADPLNYALNKVNPAISLPIEELFNKQWLTTKYSPPIWNKNDPTAKKVAKGAEHAASKFVPITGRQMIEQGPAGLGGFFGFPVYGQTAEQRAKEREERRGK